MDLLADDESLHVLALWFAVRSFCQFFFVFGCSFFEALLWPTAGRNWRREVAPSLTPDTRVSVRRVVPWQRHLGTRLLAWIINTCESFAGLLIFLVCAQWMSFRACTGSTPCRLWFEQ